MPTDYMRDLKSDPLEGDLRVWWNPQVGSEAGTFWIDVVDVYEAAKLLDVLAEYDLFQYENNVKPDYANAGGLVVFEDGEWCDWLAPDDFEDDPRRYVQNHPKTLGDAA